MDNDLFLWSDCDFKNPEKFSDVATITQMDLLPIKSVSYGPITYEFQAANATVGPLICYPLNSQWNMFDQVIENEEKIEDIHQEFIEMKEGFEKKIDENEEKVDANQEKIDVVQKAATEMKEEFEETIEHIQEEQEMVQRHTNETLEKLDSKLQDINSTLGKSFNFKQLQS